MPVKEMDFLALYMLICTIKSIVYYPVIPPAVIGCITSFVRSNSPKEMPASSVSNQYNVFKM
jgi:hypothetical protein